MLSIDTKKALAAVLESLNKASSDVPVFVPVTDSIYIRRLEKALTKNFDYIRRLPRTISLQHLRIIYKFSPKPSYLIWYFLKWFIVPVEKIRA